jgi:hypothetical protein
MNSCIRWLRAATSDEVLRVIDSIQLDGAIQRCDASELERR